MTSLSVLSATVDVSRLVKMIHDRPEKLVMAVTGGFAGLQQILWETPGASRTLLEATMPYACAAFDRYVGAPQAKYCSMEAAIALARTSYARAKEIVAAEGKPEAPVLGLGATAALVTDRVKKGGYRFFVAVVGPSPEELTFTGSPASGVPGDLSREAQGRYSDLAALDCLLEALKLPRLKKPPTADAPAKTWEPWTLILADGQRMPLTALHPDKHLLFPGSFNPLHAGHEHAARAAEEQTGLQSIYLIECEHPDKGVLPDAEIERRLRQFSWKSPLVVTQGAGLYMEKAERFPGFGFIVGADTMRRICDPKYGPVEVAVAAFLGLGTRFYVFDRIDGERLRTLDDIEMDPALRLNCTRLEGRWDLSSSELRAKASKAT